MNKNEYRVKHDKRVAFWLALGLLLACVLGLWLWL